MEPLINKNILEHKDTEDISIHEYEIISGLIASKILKKDYFEMIFEKYMRIAQNNDYPSRTRQNVNKIFSYLIKL